MEEFAAKVERTVRKFRMLKFGDRVLVAISGGPDSLALSSVLVELRGIYKLTLHLLHLNHKIRGAEAREDAEFVEKLARSWDLPFTMEERDVSTMMEKGSLSPEEAARKIRYQFFQEVARRENFSKLATGHTADDCAETFLMRLLRGAGEQGLKGIPPVREWEGLTLVRPLIEMTRAEVESYLKRKGLIPRRDSTNIQFIYLRNRIRGELLPLLTRKYNPQIKKILLRTSEILREEDAYLRSQADRVFSRVLQQKNGTILRLDWRKLRRYPIAIRRRVVRRAWEEFFGDLKEFSYSHWEEIERLFSSPKGTVALSLPQGVVVSKEYGTFSLERKKEAEELIFEYSLEVPGKIPIRELDVEMETSILKDRKRLKLKRVPPHIAFFDWEKILSPMVVRNLRKGDWFQPLGLGGRKKVRRFLMDRKVPLEKRMKVPLLLAKGRVIWVVGWEIDERVKVTPETRRILRVEVRKIEKSPY